MKRLFAMMVLTMGVAVSTMWSASARAAELVFFMSEACGVCARWEEEVGRIYPKTEEGKVLPLRVQSVHDDPPADLALVKGITFTPTFVIVEDGQEIGRMVGYISDYFFWDQIGVFIKQLKAQKNADTASCVEGGEASSAC